MTKLITAVEPQRDQNGYWTHPDYFVPANGMEFGAPGEFAAWLDTNRIVGHLQWMESDVTDEQLEALESGDGDISQWNPTAPAGDAGLSALFTILKTAQFATGSALSKVSQLHWQTSSADAILRH